MDMQACPLGSLLRESSGYRSRTCYLQLMRLKLVIPFHPPAKPVPGIEPGSSAWKADVLAVTPHGRKQVTGLEPVNSPWQSDAFPITRYLQKASRRIRTDSLLITKQLRFRCAREAKSELQESNLRKLLIRQVPYHWTKLQKRERQGSNLRPSA